MKNHSYRSIAILFVLQLLFPPSIQSPASVPAQSASFTFTAVGDYGATANTSAVLEAIAAASPSFHLALGDLSYGSIQPESAWCDYVRSHVGSTLPFELLSGNHDSGANASEGNIN